MNETAVIVAGVVVWLAGLAWGFWDLSRHEVTSGPRWVWALVIALVTFPVGLIIYLVVGRGPRRGASTPAAAPVRTRRTDELPSSRDLDRSDVVIATTELRKQYEAVVAVDGVDLAVPRRSVYGLVGPNGAGKTTLLSLLARLRHATSGTIEMGAPATSVAVLPDSPDFPDWLTAYEVVDLARHLVDPSLASEHVDRALQKVGLLEVAERRVGGFSRGMLQRLGLATCLVGDPEILLLDEPSSALDPAGRREILDLIALLSSEKTVVLSTHILGDVQQVCDTVGVLQDGRLRFQGPIGDLLERTGAVFVVRTRGDLDHLATHLAEQDWVSRVERTGPATLRVHATDADRFERGVARVMADVDAPLVSVTPAADLEAAFLELTA